MLDVTASLAPERDALLELLRGLAIEQWDLPTECPAWTVKGLALHVLGDDFSLLSRQRDATPKQGLILYAESHPGLDFRRLLDGFNEQWVTAASFLSSDLVIEMLRRVGEWSEEFYCSVGLGTMSAEPVGFFADHATSPYWKVIAREFAERFIHQSQLRRALGANELTGSLVADQARVSVHALAAWFSTIDAPIGTSIIIRFGDLADFAWIRDEAGWCVASEAEVSNSSNATVEIPSESVVPALSRGLEADEVHAIAKVRGDKDLVRRALDVAAPLLGRPQPSPRPFG